MTTTLELEFKDFTNIWGFISKYKEKEKFFWPDDHIRRNLTPEIKIRKSDFHNYPSNYVQFDSKLYFAICYTWSNTMYSGGGPGDYTLYLYSLEQLESVGIEMVEEVEG